jgi:hypothetical protein
MKNLIKRPYVGWVSSVEYTRDFFDSTIYPSWYEEVTESNRFLYRFNSGVNSIVEDLKREQQFIISQFSFDTLDVTKPFYISAVDNIASIKISDSRFLLGRSTDGVYNDIFRACVRIEDLGEQYIPKFAKLKELVDQGFYSITNHDTIRSAEERVYIFDKIKKLLLPGETILGGELLSATSLGRVIDTEKGEIVSGLEKVEYESSRDNGFFLLPLLTDLDSIKFFDINDEEIEIEGRSQVLGFSSAIEQYVPDYDIDQDGYISELDIEFIRNAEGRNTLNTPEADWRNIYFKLDKDQDGNISSSDIALAELNVHGVKEKSIIVRKPVPGYCRITYLAYPEPYITYVSPNLIVRGGTFGYDMQDSGAIDPRIADGYIETSSGLVLGMNRSRTEIWTGRLIEDRYNLSKVSYKYQSRMSPVAMTSVDEVCFFLLKSNTPDFRVFGSQYAILRIDARKEKVEISNDLIAVNYELPDAVEFTGIQSTSRKDVFRLFTSEGDTFTFKMLRNYVLSEEGNTWISEGSERFLTEGASIIKYQRIYNDVDSFGFNFALNRLPFETNEKFMERIFRKVSDPPNNSIQGMHSNYSLELGIYEPLLYREVPIDLINTVDVNSEIRLVLKDPDFLRYSQRVITIHVNNPTLVEEKTSKPVFVSGIAEAMIDDQRVRRYYILNGGDYLEERLLILRKDTLLRICNILIAGNSELVADMPDYEEDLVWFKNVGLRLEYTAIDPDGVTHTNAYQDISIDVPSRDLISTSKVYTPGSYAQISRNSKTSKYIPVTYAMIREGAKEHIGEERWNKRIEEILSGDTSFWGKTILNVSPFDDKYVSTYVVDKSLYNCKGFDLEVVEVPL